jgi:hypothetical protein
MVPTGTPGTAPIIAWGRGDKTIPDLSFSSASVLFSSFGRLLFDSSSSILLILIIFELFQVIMLDLLFTSNKITKITFSEHHFINLSRPNIMEIPLAEDLIKGLALLRDPAKIPNDVFGDLIRITVDIVANVQTEESISSNY